MGKILVLIICCIGLTACSGFERPERRVVIFNQGPHHDFSLIKTSAKDTTHITFDGDITKDSAAAFRATLDRTGKIDRLQLASPGGLLHEAYELRDRIETSKPITIAQGECFSACTHLFIAGETRAITPDAKLGFHMIGLRNAGNKDIDVDQALEIVWRIERRYWESRGVDSQFLDQVRATPHNDIWIPDLQTLVAQNIVTHILANERLVHAETYCQSNNCRQ